jgi:HSP20 family protein
MRMVSQVKTDVVGDQDAFLELPRKMNHGGRAAPRIDGHEADGMIELIAEVPGVPESAIEVTLDGDVLTIAIEKSNQNEGKRVHIAERVFGRFRRSIQLPFAPDPDRVEAALQSGLLTIRFPRVDRDRSRRIAIGGALPEAQRERSAIGSGWAERATPSEPLTLDVKASAPPPSPVRDL